MRRVMLVMLVSCMVGMWGVGLWLASRPPIQLLLPPDTDDIRVAKTGWGEWTVTYRTPRQSNGWHATVAHQLEAHGWARGGEQYTGGPVHDPPIYLRMTSFGLVVLWEQAELDGDQRIARVRLRRWITLLR